MLRGPVGGEQQPHEAEHGAIGTMVEMFQSRTEQRPGCMMEERVGAAGHWNYSGCDTLSR